MKYDINLHIYQRIENFLTGIETQNLETVSNAYENLKELTPPEFKNKAQQLEQQYENDLQKIDLS